MHGVPRDRALAKPSADAKQKRVALTLRRRESRNDGQWDDNVMQEITGDMKVADVVRRWPETAAVFRSRGCQDMRGRLTARIMTLRNAARMEGIDLAPLLEDLNRAAAHARPQEA